MTQSKKHEPLGLAAAGRGVVARMTTVPEDRFHSAGYRDAMNQIGYEVQSISRDLSALESRLRYGRGW